MNDFKKMPKMQHFKTGGSVKKYQEGGDVKSTPSSYHVYDNQTGERVNRTEYKNLKTANRAVDRLDDAHGGYRYTAKPASTQQKPLGPVDMTGSMGNTGGKPETDNYRRSPSSRGGSMGGGDMSGMKGLDKPYKRGGRVKK
jgi:hypothetical protein